MAIALSTAWNAYRHNNANDIIQEITDLGLTTLELSFNLTKEIVRDIELAVKDNRIKVTSLHNYCPIPDGLSRNEALPDCYSLASCDEEERAQAVKFTKRTIDTALKLNASAVVLHCGRVKIEDPTRKLISFYDANQLENTEALKLKKKILEERNKKADLHFLNIIKSLEELSKYSQRLNIKIGIETRYYFREIPSFEEIGKILEYFKGSNIYYWHDTGHAQLWENMGFIKHEDYLSKYAGYLLGIHLHDIEGSNDHLAPLKGRFNFNILKPYVKKDTLLTLEAHPPATSEDIILAMKYLEGIFQCQ